MTARPRGDRRGYVLLVVMWSVVAMGAIAATTLIAARDAVATAQNRAGIARAQWLAEGCVSVALARIDDALRDAPAAESRWEALDSLEIAGRSGCDLSIRPVGTALNVNSANEADLYRMALAAGLGAAHADSLAAAIIDWRDADSTSRPAGAEASWYHARGRVGPRNATYQNARELRLVRGAEWLSGIDTLFTADSDFVLLTRAPFAVLAGLPHVGEEAALAIIAARRERPFPDLAFIADRLSPPARLELVSALPDLLALTSKVVQSWTLAAAARDPTFGVSAGVEVRIARDGTRPAVVRRITWP